MYNCPGLLITDIRISRWCHKENSIQLFHIENYFILCVVATGGCFYVFFKQIHAEFSFKTYDVLILLKINCIIVTMPVILQVYDDNITDVHNNETAIELSSAYLVFIIYHTVYFSISRVITVPILGFTPVPNKGVIIKNQCNIPVPIQIYPSSYHSFHQILC